jgi:hypothetical protein
MRVVGGAQGKTGEKTVDLVGTEAHLLTAILKQRLAVRVPDPANIIPMVPEVPKGIPKFARVERTIREEHATCDPTITSDCGP